MAKKLTFIHSGDVHLGAPFRGLRALSPAWADRLVRAIPEAFDRVIDACIKNRVDFLLLAGDVFDTDKPSYAHYAHLMKGLKRLEARGIRVYMITGNHDPFANWKHIIAELPSNVVMFPSDRRALPRMRTRQANRWRSSPLVGSPILTPTKTLPKA